MFGLERAAPCDVGITEALVGDGVVNPGDSRRLALAPDQPGVGTPETATGPGVDTFTARGGAYSFWLQRFAYLLRPR